MANSIKPSKKVLIKKTKFHETTLPETRTYELNVPDIVVPDTIVPDTIVPDIVVKKEDALMILEILKIINKRGGFLLEEYKFINELYFKINQII
jgi:hypothetical protein